MSTPQSMTTDHHPSDETLAVYAEGKLSGKEREEVEKHLVDCEQCYSIWQGDVEFLASEPQASGGTLIRAAGRFGTLLAAAAALAVVFLVPAIRERIPGFEPTGMRALVLAVEKVDKRPFEPRLSANFPYRESETLRGPEDDVKIDEKLMRIRAEEVSTDPKSDAREKATAFLLQRKWDAAITTIEQALAADGPDADLLNDLAVAHVQKPDYDRALDAIDRGLAIEKTPALLFNRALVLQYQGETAKARAAWDEYLKRDPDSQWAKEAQENRNALTE